MLYFLSSRALRMCKISTYSTTTVRAKTTATDHLYRTGLYIRLVGVPPVTPSPEGTPMKFAWICALRPTRRLCALASWLAENSLASPTLLHYKKAPVMSLPPITTDLSKMFSTNTHQESTEYFFPDSSFAVIFSLHRYLSHYGPFVCKGNNSDTVLPCVGSAQGSPYNQGQAALRWVRTSLSDSKRLHWHWKSCLLGSLLAAAESKRHKKAKNRIIVG